MLYLANVLAKLIYVFYKLFPLFVSRHADNNIHAQYIVGTNFAKRATTQPSKSHLVSG